MHMVDSCFPAFCCLPDHLPDHFCTAAVTVPSLKILRLLIHLPLPAELGSVHLHYNPVRRWTSLDIAKINKNKLGAEPLFKVLIQIACVYVNSAKTRAIHISKAG